MDPLTLPPGVTVGPETAETCYTITAAGSAYRYGYGPMMVAVCAVDALTS